MAYTILNYINPALLVIKTPILRTLDSTEKIDSRMGCCAYTLGASGTTQTCSQINFSECKEVRGQFLEGQTCYSRPPSPGQSTWTKSCGAAPNDCCLLLKPDLTTPDLDDKIIDYCAKGKCHDKTSNYQKDVKCTDHAYACPKS